LEDFAAEMFNADPEVTVSYTGESWSTEFMRYGCYCNKLLTGGGRLPQHDEHEALCMGNRLHIFRIKMQIFVKHFRFLGTNFGRSEIV